jgi:hypothetical protein
MRARGAQGRARRARRQREEGEEEGLEGDSERHHLPRRPQPPLVACFLAVSVGTVLNLNPLARDAGTCPGYAACGGRLAPGTQPADGGGANMSASVADGGAAGTGTGTMGAAPDCGASGTRCVLCAETWLCPSGSFANCPATIAQGGPCATQPECLQCIQGTGAVYECSGGSWDMNVLARTETSRLCPP